MWCTQDVCGLLVYVCSCGVHSGSLLATYACAMGLHGISFVLLPLWFAQVSSTDGMLFFPAAYSASAEFGPSRKHVTCCAELEYPPKKLNRLKL